MENGKAKKLIYTRGGVIILLAFVAMPIYGMIRTRSYPFGSGLVLESVQMATFIFSTRNSVWVHITGMGFERAIAFHKIVGTTTILLAAFHASWTGIFEMFYLNELPYIGHYLNRNW